MHRRVWVALLLALPVGSCLAEVTYTRDVARIFQAKCQQCHRPNDIAPFPLLTYDDAETWAQDIRDAVGKRIMPPWKPVPGYNEFRDSFGLTDAERQTILDWVDQGAVQGDPADLPDPPPVSTSQWQLDTDPDLVLSMPEYTPPRSKEIYRCFVLPTGLEESKFVNAVQAVPGDKQQVHHVLLFIDPTGQADKLDGKDGEPGYTCFGDAGINLGIGGALGGWAPGLRTRPLPDGIAITLPAKSRLVMQVHYHPNGRMSPDKTQVGLWFTPADKVRKHLVYVPLLNTKFEIPAGAKDYVVTASLPVLPFLSAQAIVVAPHMHLLGKKIRVDVLDRDGAVRPMIYIDDWDFNYQAIYTFVEPMRLPSGSIVKLTAVYDNSADNPRNPNNPPQPVRWGEGTEDEMDVAFIGVVFDYEALIPFSGNRK